MSSIDLAMILVVLIWSAVVYKIVKDTSLDRFEKGV